MAPHFRFLVALVSSACTASAFAPALTTLAHTWTIGAASSDSHHDEDYHDGNVLMAQNSIYKEPLPRSNYESCMWPTFTVHPKDNVFLSGIDIDLPSFAFERSFEYASLWVEHYYRPLIGECKRFDKLDIVKALYQWYSAQFTLDYIEEHQKLTKDQFRYASYLSQDSNLLNSLDDPKLRHLLQGCHALMKSYTTTMMDCLPPELYKKVKYGTDGFFKTSIEQMKASSDNDHHRSDMSVDEYLHHRAINAGGVFGFVEQCHILQWLHPDEKQLNDQLLLDLASNVGLHVALANDIYGLDRDEKTGDLNIVLKYETTMSCSREEALYWAVKRMQKSYLDIHSICSDHQDSIPAKFQVALDCIGGNHGAHEICKRYRLPEEFSWPEECLI